MTASKKRGTPNSIYFETVEVKDGKHFRHVHVNPHVFGDDIVAMSMLLVQLEAFTPAEAYIDDRSVTVDPQTLHDGTFVWALALYYMKYGFVPSRPWFEVMTLLCRSVWFQNEFWDMHMIFFELIFEIALRTPVDFYQHWEPEHDDDMPWHDLAGFFESYARGELGLPQVDHCDRTFYHAIEVD